MTLPDVLYASMWLLPHLQSTEGTAMLSELCHCIVAVPAGVLIWLFSLSLQSYRYRTPATTDSTLRPRPTTLHQK